MTGVEELREVHVVSAAPEVIRVSVVGGRTQLDVALPADIPVAAFLPELARLIKSRDAERAEDLTDRDERRTFWVLSRAGGADALDPDRSLRAAGGGKRRAAASLGPPRVVATRAVRRCGGRRGEAEPRFLCRLGCHCGSDDGLRRVVAVLGGMGGVPAGPPRCRRTGR
ncbi:hypothetical protein ATO49_26355 [Mycolicibacterium fortuitum subsp. fortuitum DSM 46621 = ATCC 6841 = JCM 6387]|nr:hypothetical protein ATO49_26355 [Mycolicibacterium fortuitum subsp. fortuitum DSM 46621 = ATCC 6841 = JCM 6387]